LIFNGIRVKLISTTPYCTLDLNGGKTLHFRRGFIPPNVRSYLVLPELPSPSTRLSKRPLNGLIQARLDPLKLNGLHQVFLTGSFINWAVLEQFAFPLEFFFHRKLQAVPGSLEIKFIICCEPEECEGIASALHEAGFNLTGNGKLMQSEGRHHLWFVLPAQDLPIIGEGIHQMNIW
jgi:hypothetical protein